MRLTYLRGIRALDPFIRMTPREIADWLAAQEKPVDRDLLKWLVVDPLFERQEGCCARCREKLGALIDIDLDHITPRFRGGRDVMENLQLLCVACHRRKTRRDLSGATQG